jgi:hypothetical protein
MLASGKLRTVVITLTLMMLSGALGMVGAVANFHVTSLLKVEKCVPSP